MPALTENGQDKNFREVTIETILLQRWKVGFKKKKRKAKPSFDEIFCRVRLILTLLLFKSSSWRFEFALQSLVIYIFTKTIEQLSFYFLLQMFQMWWWRYIMGVFLNKNETLTASWRIMDQGYLVLYFAFQLYFIIAVCRVWARPVTVRLSRPFCASLDSVKSVPSSSVTASWWIRSLSWEYWMRCGNAPWMGRQSDTGHRAHTVTHMSRNLGSSIRLLACFGTYDEPRGRQEPCATC